MKCMDNRTNGHLSCHSTNEKENQQGKFQWTNVRHQYFGTIAANLMMTSHGCVMGWISPALPILTSTDTPLLSGPLTNEQVSLIGSINCIGALVGSLSFGLFTSLMGCKRAMLFLAIPTIMFWLLIFFGQTYYHILIARFISGFGIGGAQTTIVLYVSEIANDDIRGKLGGFSLFLRNIGILIGYTLGATVDYVYIPCICVFMPIIYAMIFVTLPNIPRYYLQKGQIKEAEDALKYYKGYTGKSVEENIALNDELLRLQQTVIERKAEEKLKASDICNRTVLKGLGVGVCLSIFAQLTSNFTTVTYAVTIFKKMGTSFNPYASSIVLAFMLILGSSATTYLADWLGRKRLNFISLMGSAVGQFASSLYHYLYLNGHDLSAFAWVPVTSLSFVIFCSSAGILPLQLICAVEYLPSKMRTLGMSLISCAISLSAFTAVKLFPILVELLDLHGCMLIYGIGCFVGAIFVVLVLKETSGKSLDDIGKNDNIKMDCIDSKKDITP